MAEINRWKKAQQAERDHDAHRSIMSDTESAKKRVEDTWNVDVSTFSDESVLAVGGGTGLVHGLERPSQKVSLDPIYESRQVTESDTTNIAGCGEKIPVSDGHFDTVFSHNVLDHTLEPGEVLQEIRRVLKPDGRFLLSVHTFGLPRFIRTRLDLVDAPHPHHFSQNEIEQLLEDSGFVIEQTSSFRQQFENRGVLSLLLNNEPKKAAGKLAGIERFNVICRPK